MILSVGECAGKTIQSKIPDLNIIHENPEFYNAVFAKVKYKLVDLRNLSSIWKRTGDALCVLFRNQAAGFTLMMCGFAPSYQYRKPSISTTSPALSSPTALYTSVSVPVRYTSTQKL